MNECDEKLYEAMMPYTRMVYDNLKDMFVMSWIAMNDIQIPFGSSQKLSIGQCAIYHHMDGKLCDVCDVCHTRDGIELPDNIDDLITILNSHNCYRLGQNIKRNKT